MRISDWSSDVCSSDLLNIVTAGAGSQLPIQAASMSTRPDTAGEDPTIEDRGQLIRVFEQGSKHLEHWRIGTEHEKFVYRTADHRAPSYDEPSGLYDHLMAPPASRERKDDR